MTIREFLETLRHRWRIIVATMLIVLAATAWVTMQTPAVYESSTRVYLLAGGEGTQGNLYNMPGSEKETLIQVAASPIVLDPVREQLGLGAGTPMSVRASTVGDTNLLDVVARSDDPQRAADIATAVPQQLATIARNYAPSLSQSGQTVEAQVVSPAGPRSTPVTPNVPRNLTLGALAGLMLGVAFALARQAMDLRVREPRDIEAISERPVLSSIPLRKSGDPHGIYLDLDPFGSQAEAIRRLRTNLMFVDVTTGKHSFVISSTLPGEGKTTTAINLGLAMSDAGTKVLLIDADLRHPSVATSMGLEGGVGLTTVLLGEAEVDDVIQRWGGTNLHVLAAGEIPPNPSELLGSAKMQALFADLSERYDFILVDTPPVLPVTDAVVMEKLTGGILMVVAAGDTRKRHVSEALRVLSTADSHVAGFILTKTAGSINDYYYQYHGNDRRDRTRTKVKGPRSQRTRPSRRDKKMQESHPHAATAAAQREQRAVEPLPGFSTEAVEVRSRSRERMDRRAGRG
ncbi:polysaccharide biosynthesis tyrosine autokinase [Ornithinimicrobium panacihumi]|uniref:polysaccharide biosynthesis tyrosine autokinase n=1 Tax=Ornithinimicrobium panacihumi TaxID=2008449 RepID=UPI003F8C40CD